MKYFTYHPDDYQQTTGTGKMFWVTHWNLFYEHFRILNLSFIDFKTIIPKYLGNVFKINLELCKVVSLHIIRNYH